MAWQKAPGYTWHALIKANISRFKKVSGTSCNSVLIGVKRQATEVAIVVSLLNQMFELGRPEYVRLA